MNPVPPDHPDHRVWVEHQRKLAAAAPTLYSNRAVVSFGGQFVRMALGDQYDEDTVFRSAFLLSIEDAEELAILLWDQAQHAREARAAAEGKNVGPR